MKDLIKNLKFAWKYAKGQEKSLAIVIITNILSIVSSIIVPILSAKIIIELTTNNYNRIIFVGLMIFLVETFNSISHYLINKYSTKMYREVLSKLGVELGENILKIKNECLDKHGSGVFIQRLTNDTSRLADVFNMFLSLITNLIRNIGILVAIFIVNKLVFIYVIVMLVILYCLEKIRTDKRNEDDKVYRKSQERVSGFIGELVRGARDIKMLNSEKDFIKELDKRIDDANYKDLIMKNRSYKYRLGIWCVSDMFSFLLIVVLVLLMKYELIVPAIALVLHNYANNVSYSVYLIGDILNYVKDFNLSSERIYEILNGDEFKKEQFGNKHINKIKGCFEFKNVSFSYDNKKILDNLCFKIKANETVAFVGKSGAGKTTIFNLLCKMYDVKEGVITIDGININDLDKDSIRSNITIISQNPYIFNMSIKDNLKLVKSNLTKKEMIDACKIACLDDFINELPNKYDTIIGEGGVNLSGGQKQRLAIARALIQKTEIILFDEATSALDNETQNKIQQAIDNMKNEYTILIIAHRLSTIKNSNRILYLDNGMIEAEGTHNQLIKKCKKYKDLYESEIIKENK
ncbi:MAG: ABC transporter ATP-binding protein [Firmicutes bacterium]|nr:ABC transporter ATP-binding protein [Bacillota bacterium]